MSVFDTLLKNRPDPWTIARWFLLIAGVSILSGAFVFHVFFGIREAPGRWGDLLANIGYSSVYVTIMASSLRVSIDVLRTHVPPYTRWNVALHVGSLSVVAVVSYALATMICWAINPSGFSLSWKVLLFTATLALLVSIGWGTLTYTRAFYQRLREAEVAKYEARLEALRAQINPHFLFNAFNSIAALIRTRPDEAEAVVEDLADLFRYALQASKSDVSTLREEIEAAERYLAVEQARFRDRLHVEVDVPEPLRSVSIPAMTIQPLVENAVKHGVAETRDECTVQVVSRRENGHLALSVTDTGPGFDTTDLGDVIGEGTGLTNVQERLQLFFGEEAELALKPNGVEIRCPLDDTEPSPVPDPLAE